MAGLALRQLRRRLSRVVALFTAIVIAAMSFALLAGTAQTSRLAVTSTVNASARPAYDLLVRPKASRLPAETELGLVQPGHLAGQYGGISLDQWQAMLDVSDVDIAAPIAMAGFGMTSLPLPVDLSSHVAGPGREVLRVDVSWHTDRGLTTIPGASRYLYATDSTLGSEVGPDGRILGSREELAGGGSQLICGGEGIASGGAGGAGEVERLKCWSPKSSGALTGGRPEWTYGWIYPYLIVAVDPEQEARLTGLDQAVVAGRGLTSADTPQAGEGGFTSIPVVVAASPSLDRGLAYRVSRLPDAATDQVLAGTGQAQLLESWRGIAGTEVAHGTIDASAAYRSLVQSLKSEDASTSRRLFEYFTAGPVSYQRDAAGTLTPAPVEVDRAALWGRGAGGEGTVGMPGEAADLMFRQLAVHRAQSGPDGTPASALFSVVGEFDPAQMPQQNELSTVPMETYVAPTATGADARAAALLGGRDLLPNANIGGLLTSAATMLTPLSSLQVLHDQQRYSGVDAQQAAAPISVVRVRLKGDIGLDALSQERLRSVAEQISQRTGLEVDIMVGSSPSQMTIAAPAGQLGRPDLMLRQDWVSKGVATVIVAAVDRKSVLLFGLILVVAALFVTNATAATVRSRRSELAVLACLGWSRRHLASLVLVEVLIIGGSAGLAGAALALPLAAYLGQRIAPWWLALTVLCALTLALIAAAVPAIRAGRTDPGVAVRPQVVSVRTGTSKRTIGGFAAAYLMRVPGRTGLGVLNLLLGVAALTVLLAITTAFKGTVSGTLLGDAVTLQARAADYIAIGVVIALAVFSVIDILYLNIRDTGTELATLRAVGWSEGALGRLIAYQALGIGLLGSVLGAGLGVASVSLFVPGPAGAVWQVAIFSALCGLIVTVAAAVLPARAIRRLPTAQLLAEE